MRLNGRASVRSLEPQLGQMSSIWSARQRSLQLRQSTRGSVNVARWPDASQTLGFVRIAASIGTTSSRSWIIARHHASLHVAEHERAERAVVVGRADAAVDLGRGEDEPTPFGQVDDGVEQPWVVRGLRRRRHCGRLSAGGRGGAGVWAGEGAHRVGRRPGRRRRVGRRGAVRPV